MLETIQHNETVLAIIIKSNYTDEGIKFFTPDNFSQQLAYMHHPTGHSIQRHIHNHVAREVTYTQEVLVIKRGKLRVDFYDTDKKFVANRILETGDIILLACGGHGFEVLEELEMYEIKQGPYLGHDHDKTKF